jgi:hypothetical protein
MAFGCRAAAGVFFFEPPPWKGNPTALQPGGPLLVSTGGSVSVSANAYGQSDWAGDPAAIANLAENYNAVLASTDGDLEVGSTNGFVMVFDSLYALIAYLPDAGALGVLNVSLVDPTTSSSGAFGGDVVALVLDIDFSDAGLLQGNLNVHFGDLVLQNFTKMKGDLKSLRSLNGLTVRQFAADVNILLGGGSFGIYTADDIPIFDSIVRSIDVSFKDGTVFNPFATNNLAVASVPLVMQSVARSGNSISFTCSTTPTQMYQVQCLTNLSQTNWVNLGSAFRATNYTTTVSDTLTNAQMFYRIAQLP